MLAIESATAHFVRARGSVPVPRHNPHMDIVVTGSHGLIGSALLPKLAAAGHRTRRLVRTSTAGPDEIGWDLREGTIDRRALEGVDAVVHLAGAGIADHRWTDQYKREILDSRTQSTKLL